MTYTPSQQSALAQAKVDEANKEAERVCRIFESGQPAEEFRALVNDLGPIAQGLTTGQKYLNWLWCNGCEEEEWSDLAENYTYCVGKIPVTEIVKTHFPEYKDSEYIYLDHDNQGFVSELTEERAKAMIRMIEADNAALCAAQEAEEQEALCQA